MPRPIAASVFPVRRTGLFGSALLTAVVATALLSAGQARAVLDLTESVTCSNSGVGGGSLAGECVPFNNPLEDGFVWGVEGQLPSSFITWFLIQGDESSITLIFTEDAAGNFLVGNTNTVSLGNWSPVPDQLVEIDSVVFEGTWAAEPFGAPTFTNSGLPDNLASFKWDLQGANPSGGDTARVNLNFVSEPEPAPVPALGGSGLGLLIGAIAVTTALLAAGVNRSRRNA